MTGPARWVFDDAGLAALVDELASAPRYAMDTEFHRERTYHPHLALVQIAWDGGLAVVDPLAVDVAPFSRVLRGRGIAVAHAADQDLEVLEHACDASPSELFDTQVAAGFLGLPTPSLAVLVEKLLGERLTKGDRLTDWTRRPLTTSQRAYAEADVAHLLDLHDVLVERLGACGRLRWAQDECSALLARGRTPPDPDTAWWRLKDSRSLRGRARGVAQEVAAWRERAAAELDRPPRSVLPDLAMQSICQAQPTTASAIRQTRGIDGRQLREPLVEGLLAAVRRGQQLEPSELRLPPGGDVDRKLRPAVALAAAWISQLAHELQIDAQLLATRNDLQAFLNDDPNARLAHGWRSELIAGPVRRVVEGRAAVAFRPGSGELVLEERSGQAITVDIPVPEPDEGPSLSPGRSRGRGGGRQ